MLRIVSQASSVEALAGLFAGLCDGASLVVLTRAPAAPGTHSRFVLTLFDGTPVMAGTCEVEPDPAGMRLRFVELDDPGRALAAHLAAHPPGPAPGPQSECAVYQDADAAPPAPAPLARPAVTPRPRPRRDELTEIVRPLSRATRRKTIAMATVVSLLVALIAAVMLWDESPSAPSTSAPQDAGADTSAPPDAAVPDAMETAESPPAPQPVELEIVSRPAGAAVSINGKKIGTTPVAVTLEPHVHVAIVMRKSGYQTYRERVYLEPPRVKLEAALRKRR